MRRVEYDLEMSMMIRGIAIILMLMLHCFASQKAYEGCIVCFYPFSQDMIQRISSLGQLCVSMFAFISGYGLYQDYDKYTGSGMITENRWCLYRYIKVFSGYWYVWALSAIFSQIIDGRTVQLYFNNGMHEGFVYSALDFLGLSKLFSTPTLNSVWWYMSAVIVYILLLPLLYNYNNMCIIFLCLTVILPRILFDFKGGYEFPGYNSILVYLIPFMIGTVFKKYDIVNQWLVHRSDKKWINVLEFLLATWLLIFGYILFQEVPIKRFWEYHLEIYPILLILYFVKYLSIISGAKTVLSFIGKHSMNIYLTHSIIKRYFKEFVYAPRHFVLIVLFLIGLCSILSIIIERSKEGIGYAKCIKRIIAIITKQDLQQEVSN